MNLATYDPSKVNLYLAGIYQTTGFSPNSVIKISRNSNYFETFTGGVGSVERMKNTDTTYTIEISLSQTSPSNTVLNALATLDYTTGSLIFPIFAKDSSGESIFLSGSCWVERPAEAVFKKDIEERTWVIKCHEMIFGLAGNGNNDALSRLGQIGTIITQVGANLGVF